ncbi:hypothetical protein PHACT_05820 [Pseudohongiella acticola]|uniref:Peptidase C-terminal archaeal/bacterial domain-containing protein n=1 Tax=Pseudohongiella acticola TaxID=1524254 RepID=A0A1E8CJY2_9GAMM|nr:hypothetical protein [Pseudohongiella acticola]OFE12714.1 hypothetical protein PHACT_05820 [Pseudohongiella acticola]
MKVEVTASMKIAGRLALAGAALLVGMPLAAQEVVTEQDAAQETAQTPSAPLVYSGLELSPGTVHAGELQESHPQMNDGTYADCFQLRPQAGMEYTVTLRSDDFDSFLLIGVGSCDEVLIQLENDDFEEESLDAQVVFAAEYDHYSIYVNTYDPGTTGAYTLSLTARLLPMAPAGG